MSNAGAAMMRVADAQQVLFNSLDEEQKRRFVEFTRRAGQAVIGCVEADREMRERRPGIGRTTWRGLGQGVTMTTAASVIGTMKTTALAMDAIKVKMKRIMLLGGTGDGIGAIVATLVMTMTSTKGGAVDLIGEAPESLTIIGSDTDQRTSISKPRGFSSAIHFTTHARQDLVRVVNDEAAN